MTQELAKEILAPSQDEVIASLGNYGYGWADADVAGASAKRGLSEEVVADISAKKGEPEWMLQARLKALAIFNRKPMPSWGGDLSGIDFDNIKYFVRSTEKQAASWEDLPADIKNTYDKLGPRWSSRTARARSTSAPPSTAAASPARRARCASPCPAR